MPRPVLVVIESPCAPQPMSSYEDHKAYLGRCLHHAIAQGEAPIASHGLFAFTELFQDSDLDQREMCMAAGWAWMREAEKVVVYTDYGTTPGMHRGIAQAAAFGVPISYRTIGRNPS